MVVKTILACFLTLFNRGVDQHQLWKLMIVIVQGRLHNLNLNLELISNQPKQVMKVIMKSQWWVQKSKRDNKIYQAQLLMPNLKNQTIRNHRNQSMKHLLIVIKWQLKHWEIASVTYACLMSKLDSTTI